MINNILYKKIKDLDGYNKELSPIVNEVAYKENGLEVVIESGKIYQSSTIGDLYVKIDNSIVFGDGLTNPLNSVSQNINTGGGGSSGGGVTITDVNTAISGNNTTYVDVKINEATTPINDTLALKLDSAEFTTTGILTKIGNGTLIDSAYLPTNYDFIFVANEAGLPVEGEVGKLYITEDTKQQFLWSINTSDYVDISSSASIAEINQQLALKVNSDDVYTKTQVDTSLALKANVDNIYSKTEVDTKLSLKAESSHTHTIAGVTGLQTVIDTNASAISGLDERVTTLEAPSSTAGSVRNIVQQDATTIVQNSTNFGKIYNNGASIAIPTTKTNLTLGTFSGSFYTCSGNIVTITKGGLIQLEFYSTLDGGSSTRNVELAIEISTNGGTTWGYAPNSFRLWEQASINADRYAFFLEPVNIGAKFKLAYASSGTGVSFINPTPSVLTGATGYTWAIKLTWFDIGL